MRRISKRKLAHSVYLLLCRAVKEVTMTLTLFVLPVLLAYILYHLMFSFSAVKAVVGCVVLLVMLYTNMKM